MKKLISVVIPVYNENNNIRVIYEELRKIFSSLKKYRYEIIFVNDGSRDRSIFYLKEIAKKDRNVKVVCFSRNFGHQPAISAGLNSAKGDAIISMDCDMQDPPKMIIPMIKKWETGYKIVYAVRSRRNDVFFKKWAKIFFYWFLYQISEVRIPRNVGDFRLIDKKVLEILKQMPEKTKYLRGMVAWTGYKAAFIRHNRPERTSGKTKFTFAKLWNLAFSGLWGFSLVPLKMGVIIGVISILTGSIMLLYLFFDVLLNGTYYHLFKWISIIGLIFAGIQFIFLWILGEYIGRIYLEEKDRPLYVIAEKINMK